MSKLADVLPTAINAIVADIEANVALGTHDTWKHAEPKSVTPERTPLLACWLGPSRWELIATPATYTLKPRVMVGWYLSGAKGAETGGVGDDTTVTSLVATADAIAVRLESMADGLPGVARVFGVLFETRVDSEDGAVWKAIHEMELEWL